MRFIGLLVSIVLAVAQGAVNICTICSHDLTDIATEIACTDCHDTKDSHPAHECKTVAVEVATTPSASNDALNAMSVAATLVVKIEFDFYADTAQTGLASYRLPLLIEHPQRPSLENFRC